MTNEPAHIYDAVCRDLGAPGPDSRLKPAKRKKRPVASAVAPAVAPVGAPDANRP